MYNKNYIRKLIEQFAAEDQNRIALKLYNGSQIKEVCYRELADEILTAACFLKENGLQGKHIALVGANSKKWIVAFLAIAASGNVAVPLNPALPKEALLSQCTQADVSVICGDSRELGVFEDTYSCIPYDALRGTAKLCLKDIVCPEPDRLAMLLFTSGTIGKSKAVEITYGNLASCLRSADQVFTEPGIDRIMTALPMFHIAGIRGALAMLYRFKTLCIGRGIMYLFRDMPVLQPDYILLVPLMVDSLIKIMRRVSFSELQEKYIGTNLKRICIGGATVDPDSCRYLMEHGFVIDSGYALTETTGVGTWGKWDKNHFNTIGKTSNELRCRIVDGEIQFKGPAVMKGYYKDPEATRMAIQDGWLHTGDLGFFDQDGYCYLTGRKKNVIVMSNGEKLNPEEAEKQFQNSDAIEECLIWYSKRDKILCMEVYTDNREAVRNEIECYNAGMPLSYQIHRIVYRDKPFKKTASGKLMRKEYI